jgi:NAD(P)-dependent dehydrogenase (short-subunit alcohol dehydrogenase family)
VSSLAGFVWRASVPPSATKFAMTGFLKRLRAELKPLVPV